MADEIKNGELITRVKGAQNEKKFKKIIQTIIAVGFMPILIDLRGGPLPDYHWADDFIKESESLSGLRLAFLLDESDANGKIFAHELWMKGASVLIAKSETEAELWCCGYIQ